MLVTIMQIRYMESYVFSKKKENAGEHVWAIDQGEINMVCDSFYLLSILTKS